MMSFARYLPIVILLLYSCNGKKTNPEGFSVVKGKYGNRRYEIAYNDSTQIKSQVDSLIASVYALYSTTNPNSLISRFNAGKSLNPSDTADYNHSRALFRLLDSLSRFASVNSGKAFNPGLGALHIHLGVNGEMEGIENPDKRITDSLLKLDFGFLPEFRQMAPYKADDRQKVCYDAQIPAICADQIAVYLETKLKVSNYYINFDGQIRCKGNNGHDSYWPVKIDKPVLNSTKHIEYCTVPLKNYAMSVQDKFKNYIFKGGKMYSNCPDPRTGELSRNELVSVCILAPSATEANICARTCMVLGLEKAKAFCSRNPRLKYFFIYRVGDELKDAASENLAFTPAKKEH